MPPEQLLPLTVLVAALTTWLFTPVAIRLAHATGFLDRPAGYKGHGRPTPYLGGTAIMAGVVVAGLMFGDATGQFAVLGACVLAMFALGTMDDKVNLSPLLRVVIEVAFALALIVSGNGWEILGSPVLDGILTVAWVVGVVNAVNLMDNMDGAAATVVGIAAAGIAAVAGLHGDFTAAAMALAVAGACAGFLPYNLASPSRIFMGDGGSMPLGLLLAGLSASVISKGGLGAAGIVEAALIGGLVILDTTLVTISRKRAGRPLLEGGRDHLTHRLKDRLGSARAVAAVLGATQILVVGVAVLTGQAGVGAVVIAGSVAIVGALWAIRELERIPVVVTPQPTHVPVLALAPGFEAAPFDYETAAVFAEPEPESAVEPEPVTVAAPRHAVPALPFGDRRAAPAHRFARGLAAAPPRRFTRRRLDTEQAPATAGRG